MSDTVQPAPADASAESLSELYASDPFSLTRDDPRVHRMVDVLRGQRVHFANAGKPEPKAKAPKAKAPKIENLDDLTLDI